MCLSTCSWWIGVALTSSLFKGALATDANRGVVGPVVSADPWRRSTVRPHESWRAAGLAETEQCRAEQSCGRTTEVNPPGVQLSHHHRPTAKSSGREPRGLLQKCVKAPRWSTGSLREQCEARQASTASSATPSTRDEHPRPQSGSEDSVSVRPDGAPRTEGERSEA